MRRHMSRHQPHIGIERFAGFPGHAQVSVVNRIKRAAEDGYWMGHLVKGLGTRAEG